MSEYVLGNGEVAITGGRLTKLDLPFIKISTIEKGKKIGENILNTDTVESNVTTIVIKNLAGLAVLEKAVKLAKKNLKENSKRTGL